MLKIIFVVSVVMWWVPALNAQNQSNIELRIQTGILWTSNSGNPVFPWFNGFFFQMEPKLKTSKKTSIGLRIGTAVNEKKNENYDLPPSYSYYNPDNGIIQFTNPDNGLFSIIPTFDYFFKNDRYRPHFGLGVGYHFLTNYTRVSKSGVTPPFKDEFSVRVDDRIGLLLRGGLESHKFLFGLEFNYIPKTNIEMLNGQRIGEMDNSYFGLLIGYAVGVRKSSM